MDLPVVRTLFPSLRNKNLTQIYVAVTLIICLANGALHHHIGLYLFVLFGTYWAWAYLRWFKAVGAGSGGGAGGAAAAQLRGDPREEFSFASLFPVRERCNEIASLSPARPLSLLLCADPARGRRFPLACRRRSCSRRWRGCCRRRATRSSAALRRGPRGAAQTAPPCSCAWPAHAQAQSLFPEVGADTLWLLFAARSRSLQDHGRAPGGGRRGWGRRGGARAAGGAAAQEARRRRPAPMHLLCRTHRFPLRWSPEPPFRIRPASVSRPNPRR